MTNMYNQRTGPASRSFGKWFALLTMMTGFLLLGSGAFAQVSVTATAGTVGPTSYTTLKLAFDAINAGTHQGAITIGISASTTEGTTPATLNSSGAGSASYTSVLIQPTNDGVSVSGNPVTGFGVIQLNGADNVTIDGDNPNTGGTNRNLTVSNTTTATVIANSAIRIATSTAVTSADNNTIKNCVLLGNVTGGNSSGITSTTGSSNSSFGIYCGGNGGATATGAPTAITSVTTNVAPTGTTINNLLIDNNSISQCARAIVFNGNAAAQSTGVTITNNLVGDQATTLSGNAPFTTPTTTVYTKGIWIAGTNAVTITGNSLKNILSFVGTLITGIELNAAIGTGTINVSNNTINGVALNASSGNAARGISIVSAGAPYTVSGNTINNVQNLCSSTTSTNRPTGLFVNTAATSATIQNNIVSKVYDMNTGTFGVTALWLNGGNNITLQNNFVYDVNQDITGGAAFSTTFGVNGILISAGTGHKVYHNTVNMFGAHLGTASSSNLSAAFAISSTSLTGIDVRNNIFANTMTGGTTSIAHVSMFLPSGGTSSMNLTLNNNAYYTGSTAGVHGIVHGGTTYTSPVTTAGTGLYTVANFNPAVTTGVTNLRNYTSTLSAAGTNDNASFGSSSAAPFISSTNLHLDPASAQIPNVEQKGAVIATVTTDIDGNTRPNSGTTLPDMGADEIATAVCSAANGGTISPSSASSCVNSTYTMTSTGVTTGTGISYQWMVSTTSGSGYSNVTGGSGATTTSYTTGPLTAGTYYYVLQTTCSAGPITGLSNELTIVVNALPTVGVSSTLGGLICGSTSVQGNTSVSLTATGASTYAWSPAAGLSATTGATVTANPSAGTFYTVIGTDANGCTASATQSVVVGVVPTTVTASASPSTVCSGGSSTLTGATTSTAYSVSPSVVSIQTIGSPTTLTGAAGFPYNTSGTAGDDSYSNAIALPFTLDFYGSNVSSLWISSNGYITFSDPISIGASAQRTPQTIPSTTTPNNVVALFWHDMDIRTQGSVTYGTVGTAPNRIFVINFINVPTFGATNNNTGQIMISENGTINIEVATSSANTKVLGIENAAGTVANSPSGRNNVSWTVTSAEQWSFSRFIGTWSWSPSTFLTATTGNPVLASGVTSTTAYTGIATGADGCQFAAAPVTVSVASGSPTVAVTPAGPVNLCGSATQVLTATPTNAAAPVTYAWTLNGNPVGGNTATLTTSGTGSYQVVITDNCGSTATSNAVAVTNFAIPTASAGNSGPVCSGNALNLTSTTDIGTAFSWTGPNSFTSAVQNPSIPNAATLNGGTYTVVITGPGGCTNSATTSVTVNPSPSAVTVSPSSATVCAGNSQALVANGGTFNSSGNIVLGTGTGTTALTSQPSAFVNRWAQYWNQTIYTAAELSAAGLVAGSSINSITYTTISQGDAANNTNFSIRIGNTASSTLSAFQTTGLTTVFGPVTFAHSIGANTITFTTPFVWNGTSNIIIDQRHDGVDLTNNAETFFTAAADNKNFEAHTSTTSATNTIQNMIATAALTGTASTTRLNITLGWSFGFTTSWSWTPNTSDNTASVSVTPSGTTTYTATATLSNGCTASGSATVTVNTPTASVSGPATAICSGDAILLTATAPGSVVTYQWRKDGNILSGETNATYSATAAGSYTVDVVSDGCPVSSSPYVITNTNYTITATAAANGTISPSGAVSVFCGTNQSFTIAADPGYQIDSVVVDGVNQGVITLYTFSNVTAAHSINSYYSISPCTSPATASAGSNATVCNTDYTLGGSIGGSASSATWSSSGTGTFNPSNVFGTAVSYTPSAADYTAGSVTITLTTNDPDGPGSCLPGTSSLVLTTSLNPTAAPTATCTTLYTGSTSTISANATPGSGTIASYAWTLNGNPIPGANGATYTTPANGAGTYAVTVTNSNGCSFTSSNVVITNNSGPLNGSFTIGAACGFNSIANAVAYLNANGVSGPVTFTVPSGYTETAPSGGIALNMCALSSSLVSNAARPVTFVSAGAPNPVITAGVGTGTLDAVVKLVGADYVTFNGINIAESGSNVTGTTQAEVGYALVKCDGNNGSNFNNIINCSITLNKANVNTIAIYSGNHNAANTTGLTYTGTLNSPTEADAARNGHNTFYGNSIQNSYRAFSLNGNSASTGSQTLNDTLNAIGVIGQNANVITNFGGSSTACIVVGSTNQRGISIDNNTITGGASTTAALTAINPGAGVWGNIRNNAISMTFNGTTAAVQGINISFSGGIATNPNIVNVTGNTVTMSSTTLTTGGITGITCTAGGTSAQVTVSNNTVTGCSFPAATTAGFNGILLQHSSTGTVNVLNNNSVTSNSFAGTGQFLGVNAFNANTPTGTLSMNGNVVSNNTKTSTGNMFCVYNGVASGASLTMTQNTNTVNGNVIAGGSAACTLVGITAQATSFTMNGNTVTNNSVTAVNGSAIGNVLAIQSSGVTTTTSAITNNIVNGVTMGGNSTGASLVRGILATTAATDNRTISGNNISNVNTSFTTSATCIGIISVTGNVSNIFNNKIYDFFPGQITGIFSGSKGVVVAGGTTTNVYNNLIGFDYTASTPVLTSNNAVVGLEVTGGTNANLWFNTVRLAGSGTGTTFGSSGISLTTTATTTDIRNNIINNLMPGGGGAAASASVGLRRTATALTGYATTSNNNIWYTGGSPGASNPLYFDGTTAYPTLAAFKTQVASRESASATEGVTFQSTTPASANFLKVSTSVPTAVEGGAQPIAGVTTDYFGTVRNTTSPDIGAHEDNFINSGLVITSLTASPSTGQCSAVSHAVTANITPGSGPVISATLNYTFNGVAQPAVTLVNSSGNLWTGTIPAATPTNAVVAFSVTAVDATGSVVRNGTGYQDNYLVAPTVSASPNVVCQGSNTTLVAGTNPPAAPAASTYCASTHASGCSGDNISRVVLNTLDKTTGTTCGSTSAAYSNFSGLTGTNTTTLNASSSYTLSLTFGTDGNQFFGAWIDYNHNGLYEVSEYLGSSGNAGASGTIGVTFTVPSSAYSGLTHMRIVGGNDAAVTSAQACGASSSSFGETQDYDVTISGGVSIIVSPLFVSYSWSDGTSVVGTGNPLTVATTTSGTVAYTVTAADAAGCTTSNTVNVTVNPVPAAPTGTNSNQCGVGIPKAKVSGGTAYNWYLAPTGGSPIQSSTADSLTSYSISSTTTFYVSSINVSTSCESARTAVVANVSSPDAVSVTPSVTSTCAFTDITLTANQTGSTNTYVYTWNGSPAGSGIPSTITGNPVTIQATAGGTFTYTVTATDATAGCVTTASTTVTVTAPPPVTASASPSTVCAGQSVTLTALTNDFTPGTASLGGAGNGSIGGNDGNPYRSGNGTGNEIHAQLLVLASELTAAGIAPGNITSLAFTTTAASSGTFSNFTIKMGLTTATSMTTTFQTTPMTTVFTVPSFTPAASGLNVHTFSTPFFWDGTSNLLINTCQTNNILGTATVVTQTTAFNSNTYLAGTTTSCSAVSGVVLAVRPIMQFGAMVGGQGPGTLVWTWNPGSLSGNVVTVNPTVSTTYTVEGHSNATGCSNFVSVPVTVNPLPAAPTATNSTQCGAGVPTASVSGGSAYNWYLVPTGGTAVQSSTASSLTSYSISSTTTFYVSAVNTTTNCEGPRTPVTATVNQPDSVSASVSAAPYCLGSPITLTATQFGSTNSYVYTWNGTPAAGSGIPTTVSGSTVTVTPTIAGTYSYKVTAFDATLGCTYISTVSVTVGSNPAVDSVKVSPATVCAGGTVTLNAYSGVIGTGPQTSLTYAAPGTTGNTSSDNITLTQFGTINNPSGAGGVNGYEDFTSTVPAATVIAGNSYNLTVNVANGGTEFASAWIDWNRNGVYDASEFINVPLTLGTVWAGTVSVTVPNSAVAGVIHMRVRSRFNVANTATDPNTAYTFGETEEYLLNVMSIVPQNPALSYAWTPGGMTGTTATANPTTNTTYTVVVTNAAGCTASGSVSVTVLPLPSAPVATNSTQCGVGIPTASVSGGTAYNWYLASTGGTPVQSSTASSLTSYSISSTTTFYVASVNVSTGCESVRTPVVATVTQPDSVSATISAGPYCVGSSVTLTATQFGSTNTYVYTWNGAPVAGSGIPSPVTGSSVVVTPTAGGTYTYSVNAVDATAGCTYVSSVTVTVTSAPPVDSVRVSPGTVCAGATVTLNAYSGSLVTGPQTSLTYAAPGTTGNTSSDNITLTQFGTINNPSGAGGVNGYEDFTSSVPVATVNTNTTYNLTVNVANGGTEFASAWFDWNRNGVYDASEFVNVPLTLGTVWAGTVPVLVPSTATPGVIHMRVRSRFNVANTAADPNTAYTFGETEEYLLNVINKVVQTPGLTYSWTPGGMSGATATANPTVNTTYTVTISNAGGCSSTGSVSVIVNPLPSAPVATNSTQCGFGVPTASVSGGTAYNWYLASTGGTPIQSSASSTLTSYAINSTTTFYVSSVNPSTGCESARTSVLVTVTQPDSVAATVSGGAHCGNAPLTLTATQFGSTNTYTYTWNGSPVAGSGIPSPVTGSPVTVTPTAGGTFVYTVTAVDATAGCTYIASVSVPVTAPPVISTATATPSTLCLGTSTTLTATTQSAVAGTVAIGTGSTTTQGGSPFRGGGGNACKTQILYTAAELTAAGFTSGPMTSVSWNWTTGSSGTLPNFTIFMGSTTATFLTATAEPTPATTVFPATTISPNTGTGPQSFTFTTPYIWDGTSNVLVQVCHDVPVGSSGSGFVAADNTPNVSVNQIIVGSACTAAGGGLTQSIRPTATFGGQIGGFGAGSYTWVWNPGSLSGNSVTVTPASAGTINYTVTATDPASGCTSSATVPVTVINTPATPLITTTPDTLCGPGSVTLAVTNATAGASYQWQQSATGNAGSWSNISGANTPSFVVSSISTTTFYRAYVVCAGSADTSAARKVVVNNPSAGTANNATRCGAGSATVSVSGSVGQISWYANTTGGSPLASNTTSYTTTVTATTTFWVEAVIGSCIDPAGRKPVTVTVTAAPAVNVAVSPSSTVCAGTSVTLTATSSNAGYSYGWSLNGSTQIATGSTYTFSADSTRTYYLIATDTSGGPSNTCGNIVPTLINVNAVPVVASVTATPAGGCVGSTSQLNAVANGQGPQVMPSGYCTNAATSQIDEQIFAVSFGSINNTQSELCTTGYTDYTTTIPVATVGLGASIPFSVVTDECDGPNFFDSGLAIYIDYNRDGDFDDTGELAFTTSVLTTSPNTRTGNIVIPTSATPGLTRMRVVVTEGATTPLACGSFSFGEVEDYAVNIGSILTYSWSPSAGLSNPSIANPVATIQNVGANNYTVTVTNALTGCSAAPQTVTLTGSQGPLPVITPGDTTLCFPNEIMLYVVDTGLYSSGYPAGTTVEWVGIVSGLSPDSGISSINSNTFQAIVTLPNGCQGTSSVRNVITRNVAVSSVITAPACGSSNGKIVASVTSGTAPFQYVWRDASNTVIRTFVTNNTKDSIMNLSPGTYTLEVADLFGSGNGCTSGTITYNVVSSLAVVLNMSSTPVSCNGASDGTATVTVSGGSGTLTYLWSNSAATSAISGLSGGMYTVTVSDALGCQATDSVAVFEPTAIAANFIITNPTCNGGSNGSITAQLSGGTQPYTFAGLFDSGDNLVGDSVATGLSAGGYYIIVVDNNSCVLNTSTTPVSVVNPAPIAISGFTPTSGAEGDTVVISGVSFTPVTAVSFNGTAAIYVNVVNDSTIQTVVPVGATTGLISVTSICGTATSTDTFTVVTPTFATFNLKVYVEGYYLGGGTMQPVFNNIDGVTPPDLTDTIRVEFRDPFSPATAVNVQYVIMNTAGQATMQLPASLIGNSYYIAVFHRSCVETWSAFPVTISSITTYDFTTSSSQAYDDGINLPMREVEPNVWALYSGDINQDGTVDASDMNFIDNDASTFSFGYNTSDVSGDGATDALDMNFVDNNSQLFLFTAHP